MRKRIGCGDAIIALAVGLLLVWLIATPLGLSSTPRASTPPASTPPELRVLIVRSDDDNVPEYHRDYFGQKWADEDHNGCDTRNDILARDLARPVFKPNTHNCVVLSGTLAEPYTGKVIEFRRGKDTSAQVQIDHVVALADAWRSGAWQWDRARRQAFANDPDNLLAVDGQANQDKLAASADKWLPPDRRFRCEYVRRQIAVKTHWGLSITGAEHDAMANVLSGC